MAGPLWIRHHRTSQSERCHGESALDPPSQAGLKRTFSWRARFGSAITGRSKTTAVMVDPFWTRHHRTSQNERCHGGAVSDPPSQGVPKRTLPWWDRFVSAITGNPKKDAVMVGPFWSRHHWTSQNERCHGGTVLDPPSQDGPKRTLPWRARFEPAITGGPRTNAGSSCVGDGSACRNARCHGECGQARPS